MIKGANLDYYELNAKAYVESTICVDMQPIYRHFLPLLPIKAHILDAGCGSGRDSLYFLSLGHRVTAFDASTKIAALAEKNIGQPVNVLRLQDLQYKNQFDGIWACASLLHVAGNELTDVFRRLVCALKPDGVIYCSFKYGKNEYDSQGRQFTDLDEHALQELVAVTEALAIQELWISADRRPGREQERWLNGVLCRSIK